MIAIRLREPGRWETLDLPEPGSPGPGEALVRIDRIGMCGTDWHAFAGRQPFFDYPRILGHELAVTVLETGPGSPAALRPGLRCSVQPYLHDPSSPASRSGKTNCCERLNVLGVHIDGGMRERMLLPAGLLHSSTLLSPDQLALVETLCIGAHAVERARIAPSELVLVVGLGPIGLAVAQFALLAGAQVFVADLRPERLELCARHLAIAGVWPGLPADPALGITPAPVPGTLPTAVFDATGSVRSMEQSLSLAAHGGRVVFAGITADTIGVPGPLLHRRELSILASRNASADTFRRVLDALESSRIGTAWWITHRLSLRDAPTELPRLAGDPALLKALVIPG